MVSSELLDTALKLKSVIKKNTFLIINDRIDIALLTQADGIHLPGNSFTLKQVKQLMPGVLTGKSVHSVSEAVKAENDGADYLLFGPVFRTPAKIKYGKPQGLKKLKKVCDNVNIPVYAVGGINPMRIKKCTAAGAYGIAGIREFMITGNIRKTISIYRKELGEL